MTSEQTAIVNANIDDILVVEAYAGCGKTSTLIEFCKKRASDKILYLAYNSSMASEAKTKFKNLSNVEVMTMHSLAYKYVGINYKERLGNLKANFMLYFDSLKRQEDKNKIFIANKSLINYRIFCNSDYKSLSNFIQAQKNKEELSDEIVNCIYELEERTKSDSKLTYEHDFYLKEYQLSKPQLDYDYILVDEAQDINACVVDIVLRQKAKKVFIGDTYQSIYSFRGASNSLRKIARLDNARLLRLTNSFRCSAEIAEIANDYLKLVGASADFVGLNKRTEEITQKTYISRTNAKLFEIAIKNLDKKLFFVGGLKSYNFSDLIDILNLMLKGSKKYENFEDFKTYAQNLDNEQQQQNLLNALESENITFKNYDSFLNYINKLSDEKEENKLLNVIVENIVKIKNPFYNYFKNFQELQEYISTNEDVEAQSKVNMVLANIDKNIYSLIRRIKEQSTNKMDKADIILSTAHKSKGLEFISVELIDDFVDVKEHITSDKPVQREEINLLYVAITRAKQELICDKKYILD